MQMVGAFAEFERVMRGNERRPDWILLSRKGGSADAGQS